MLTDIIVFLLILVTLFEGKITIIGFEKNYLSRESTSCYKGVLSVLVIVTHLSTYAERGSLISKSHIMGTLLVSVFFFLSAFGLASSSIKNEYNHSDFFKKRISKVIVPYIFMILVVLLTMVIQHKKIYFINIAKLMFNGELVKSTWFINEIIIIYILYWFTLRKVTGKHEFQNVILKYPLYFAVIIGIMIFCGFSRHWYVSTLAFPMGVIFANYKNELDSLLSKYYYPLLLISLILFMNYVHVITVINPSKSSLLFYLNYLFGNINFVLLMLLLIKKIKIKNSALLFLGNISYEIYLVHRFVMDVLEHLKINQYSSFLYCFLSIVVSVFTATIFKNVINIIYSKTTK